jgi:hypothetical protein
LVPESGHIILPKYQLSLASRHTIVQEHLIGPSKRAYYFPLHPNCLQQAGILFFQNISWLKQVGILFFQNISWLKQAGILFFPNYQLALANRHTILPQHTTGSSKWVYYFSPTLICPQQAGILFFPNYQLAQASGHIIFPNYQMAQASGHIIFSTFNWLQQVGIFSQNIKLAP